MWFIDPLKKLTENLIAFNLENDDEQEDNRVRVVERQYDQDAVSENQRRQEELSKDHVSVLDECARVEKEMEELKNALKENDDTEETLARLKRLEEERDKVELRSSELRSKIDELKKQGKKKREEKDRELVNMLILIRDSETVDLCFMVDCTASMIPHIEAVKNQIDTIVSRLKRISKTIEMNLSFLGYRDIVNDSEQFEILDFTSELQEFKQFLRNVSPIGNLDLAEDIAGAMQKACSLSWSKGTRILLHVADFPAHGQEYNDCHDHYPNGVGISLPDQLKTLAKDKQVQYYFSHINREETQKMIDTLRKQVGDSMITELDIASPETLTTLVTSTVCKSISKTIEDGSSVQISKPEDMDSSSDAIEWRRIDAVPAFAESVVPHYMSADDLKESNLRTVQNNEVESVQISPRLMGQGRFRTARYGKSIWRDGTSHQVILKQFYNQMKSLDDALLRYWECVEQNSIASFLAEKFNESEKPKLTIRFLQSCLLKVNKGENVEDLYVMEGELPRDKKFQKFVDNAAHWDELLLDEDNTLPNFVEFVHKFTNGYIIVTDLQGVATDSEYLLTDPAILCVDSSRFGKTNLGKEIIDKFMDFIEAYL